MPDDPLPPLTGRRAAAWLAVGAAVALGLAWTARPPGAGVAWRAAFVALHLGGFGLLLLALRHAAPSVRQLLVGAVVLRVIALPILPSLSDDGYRYLWDGLIAQEAGVSPYALRPSHPRLAAWHGEPIYERMNSPDYYSVYPPASQAVFRLSAVAYRPLGWAASWRLLKGLLVLAEVGGIVALARVVGARGAALYAWSPLAVVEIAGQGHTEALVVAGLGLVLASAWSGWPLASVGATVGGLTKLWPGGLLPFTWRREGWPGVVASLALAVALTAPVWTPDAVSHVGESLGLFFGTLDAYAAPYRLLKSALYPVLGETAGRAASGALAAMFAAAVGLGVLVDDGTGGGLRRAVRGVVVAAYLAAATLHPWYGLPVLFVVPLLENRSLLWLTTLSTAGYLTYELPEAGGVVLAVGWGGALVLALRDHRPRADRL